MALEVRPADLAGFDLIGHRQPDGTIVLGSGKALPDFPKEASISGLGTYTLEAINKNGDSMDPTRFPPDHPGWSIEWGVYV